MHRGRGLLHVITAVIAALQSELERTKTAIKVVGERDARYQTGGGRFELSDKLVATETSVQGSRTSQALARHFGKQKELNREVQGTPRKEVEREVAFSRAGRRHR